MACVYEARFEVVAEECKQFEETLRPRLSEVLRLPGVEGSDVLREDSEAKPTVVFVLGGPGAGKGTQCANIVEAFGYTHISAGDCLRAERASGSPDAELINTYIKDGKIIPVEITIKLLLKTMEASGNDKFLIDGFPRDEANLDGWNRIVGNAVNVGGMLFFDVPEDVMLARLLGRGKDSGRVDDNITSIRKRFLTYQESTMPVVHAFDRKGLVRTINGSRPRELVYLDVERIMTDIEAAAKPRVSWTVLYRLRDDGGLDGATTEHERFAEELKSKFGTSLEITSRVMRKVVDEEKAAEGACVIC